MSQNGGPRKLEMRIGGVAMEARYSTSEDRQPTECRLTSHV